MPLLSANSTHSDPGLMRNAAAKWSKLSQAEKDAYGERLINLIAFSATFIATHGGRGARDGAQCLEADCCAMQLQA